MELKKFKKVLVANRGEIAIRVFRALNELGITTVGVFSKEDRYALFRSKADESYQLNPDKGPIDAYLDINTIIRIAKEKNVDAILDGTNASDAEDDRPGMRALRELCVYSPLRICGLTKTEIRRRSKEAGLFTWNKPAYACLATRIPTNERITAEKLEKTEEAENVVRETETENTTEEETEQKEEPVSEPEE